LGAEACKLPDDLVVPPDVLKRAHENDVDGAWAMARSVEGARIQRWNGATAIRTAAPLAMSNLLAVTDVPPDPFELFERAEKFFGPGIPWRVITTGEAVAAVKRAAEQRGMVPHSCEPGMVLSPIPPAPALLPPRSVRVISTMDDLMAFQRTGAKAFGFPLVAARMMIPELPGPADQPGNPQFFVAYDGDVPVSTSVLVVSHGIAGIYFVGTVPKARGKGFATAAVWAAADAGRKMGCDAAYLQATVMGRPVYERMGFHKVDDFAEWRVRLSAFGKVRAVFSMIALGARYFLHRRRAE